MYLFHEVTCVAVLNKHCVYSQHIHANGKETDNLIPALISISDKRDIDIQSAMFISILFDYLDIDSSSKKATSESFAKLYRSKTANTILEAKLTENDWFPQTHHNDGGDFSQESVRWRLENVYKWFYGDLSTDEFLKMKCPFSQSGE